MFKCTCNLAVLSTFHVWTLLRSEKGSTKVLIGTDVYYFMGVDEINVVFACSLNNGYMQVSAHGINLLTEFLVV